MVFLGMGLEGMATLSAFSVENVIVFSNSGMMASRFSMAASKASRGKTYTTEYPRRLNHTASTTPPHLPDW